MRFLKYIALLTTIIGDLLAVFFLIKLVSPQTPFTINDTHGESTLFFSIDRQIILLPGTCVNIGWKVESIRTIYLNGEGKTGEYQEKYCPSGDQPLIFTVTFLDGTRQDYKLDIIPAAKSPQFLLLSFAVLVLSFLAVFLAKPTFVVRFLTGRERIFRADRKAALYAILITASYLILINFGQIDRTHTYFDEDSYRTLAETISTGGIGAFTSPLRTYGYPFFLSTINFLISTINFLGRIVAPPYEIVEWTMLIQFALHTITAYLAARCLGKLLSNGKLSWLLQLLCFAFVQFTPTLLSLTSYLLTDSLSTFLLTLFYYLLLTPSRLRPFLSSLVIAVAIVVRPFYGTWILALAAIVIGLSVVSYIVSAFVQRKLILPGPFNLKRVASVGLQIALPLIVIVGLQFLLTYNSEKRFALVGVGAEAYMQSHYESSSIVLKVEGYVGSTGHDPLVLYISQKAQMLAAALKDTGTSWLFAIHYPLTALEVFSVKTIGLFQNYEWAVYRTSLLHPIDYNFLYGLLYFAQFVYINLTFLTSIRLHLPHLVNWPPLVVILLIATDLHVLAYSVLTEPEHRFVAPVLPILVTLTFFLLYLRKNWRVAIISGILSLVLYFWTYQVLISAMT